MRSDSRAGARSLTLYQLNTMQDSLRAVLSFTIAVLLSTLCCDAMGQNQQEMQRLNPKLPPPIKFSEDRVAAAGIEKTQGRFITVYSDSRESEKLKELVTIFDAAVPLWCEHFEVDFAKTKPYRMTAFVMVDRERFKGAGVLPDATGNFNSGLHRGHELWMDVQKDDYYTRHLLLHEGTHAFMQWLLGGFGSPWYAEGMAEMLAVHQWQAGKLKLNYRLQDRTESAGWGRVKIIRDDYAEKNAMKLDEVIAIDGRLFGTENRSYAWSWAACKFFSEHEKTKRAFRELVSRVNRADFSQRFLAAIGKDRQAIDRDWHTYISEIDYGYSVTRGLLRVAEKGNEENQFIIDSQYGWQDTRIAVEPGDRLLIKATGRFQVAKTKVEGAEEVWPSEAAGVTIDYYRGRPLGMLVVGVANEKGNGSGLVKSNAVGYQREIKFRKSGTVCLRINESPADLDDNEGSLTVVLEKK